MKQSKKRLTLSLDQDLFDQLVRYSEVIGITKSDIVESWIAEASPKLEILIEMHSMLESASEDQLSEIQGKLERIMGVGWGVDNE